MNGLMVGFPPRSICTSVLSLRKLIVAQTPITGPASRSSGTSSAIDRTLFPATPHREQVTAEGGQREPRSRGPEASRLGVTTTAVAGANPVIRCRRKIIRSARLECVIQERVTVALRHVDADIRELVGARGNPRVPLRAMVSALMLADLALDPGEHRCHAAQPQRTNHVLQSELAGELSRRGQDLLRAQPVQPGVQDTGEATGCRRFLRRVE